MISLRFNMFCNIFSETKDWRFAMLENPFERVGNKA